MQLRQTEIVDWLKLYVSVFNLSLLVYLLKYFYNSFVLLRSQSQQLSSFIAFVD